MPHLTKYIHEMSLDLWIDALTAELGIKFACDPVDALYIQNKLYEARKDINDPRFACLSIHVPPEGNEIWIYKRAEAELEA